ncbi:MAG: glycosyltransferase, partial [Armatimonadota bacterium]|nr:glycosyltransferase [Armatimonadota bacterium]
LAPLLRDSAGQKVRLMLVGGGPAMHSLQALARELNVARQVIFTDFVDPMAIPDYYAAGDIFTFASRTETQGVSIAEALAAGLPCVVIKAMGAAESVQHGYNGFVVPPRETEFRDAVARLINDSKLRRTMSENACHSAPALSLQSRVDNLLQLYQSLAPSPTLSPTVPLVA